MLKKYSNQVYKIGNLKTGLVFDKINIRRLRLASQIVDSTIPSALETPLPLHIAQSPLVIGQRRNRIEEVVENVAPVRNEGVVDVIELDGPAIPAVEDAQVQIPAVKDAQIQRPAEVVPVEVLEPRQVAQENDIEVPEKTDVAVSRRSTRGVSPLESFKETARILYGQTRTFYEEGKSHGKIVVASKQNLLGQLRDCHRDKFEGYYTKEAMSVGENEGAFNTFIDGLTKEDLRSR